MNDSLQLYLIVISATMLLPNETISINSKSISTNPSPDFQGNLSGWNNFCEILFVKSFRVKSPYNSVDVKFQPVRTSCSRLGRPVRRNLERSSEKVLRRAVRRDLGTARRRASERFANCRKFPWENCVYSACECGDVRVTSRLWHRLRRIPRHGPALTINSSFAEDEAYFTRNWFSQRALLRRQFSKIILQSFFI